MLSAADGYNITDGNGGAGLVGAAGLAGAGEPGALALYMIGGEAARPEEARPPG